MLLTIAIPVFNGSETIESLLCSIVAQIDNNVEIVISDNASTDDTPGIISKYILQHPNIRYFRNTENVGVDMNFDLAIKRASGEYVWFIGDDDIMTPGAVQKVLSVINNHSEVDYFFANCSIWNRDFSECLSKKFIPIDNDLICENADKLVSVIGVNAALTPTTIIRKRFWVESQDTNYSGTNWGLLSRLFHNLPGHFSYIIADTLVQFSNGSPRTDKDGKFYKMALVLYDLIDHLPSLGYTQETYRKVRKQVLNIRIARTIAHAKACGLKLSKDVVCRTSYALHKNYVLLVISLILLLIPNQVYLILRYIKRRYNRQKKAA